LAEGTMKCSDVIAIAGWPFSIKIENGETIAILDNWELTYPGGLVQ
jgi:hypothetical protein